MDRPLTVIKKDMIRPSGEPVKLSPVSPQPAGQPQFGQAPPAPSGQWVARIVEQTPSAAVIEVCCPCGAKTYLRCDYATA